MKAFASLASAMLVFGAWSAQLPSRPAVPLSCCPTEDAYVAIVRAFADGDQADAAAAIATAPERPLRQAVAALASPGNKLAETAVAMHLVFAVSAADHREDALMHLQLDCAETLVHKIVDDGSFVETCYMAAVQLCLDTGDVDRARTLAARGLRELGPDARMQFADGLVNESEANVIARGLAIRALAGARAQQRRADDLASAEKAYRAAVRAAPAMLDARLRLGRVLWLRRNAPEARTVLEAVCRDATDPEVAYLAHLFLADVALSQADAPRAAREYRAAIVAAPEYPTPYLGISNLAQQAGNTNDAIRYVREWSATASGKTSDPWVLYVPGAAHLLDDVNAVLRAIAP